jgi:hypothetical protein
LAATFGDEELGNLKAAEVDGDIDRRLPARHALRDVGTGRENRAHRGEIVLPDGGDEHVLKRAGFLRDQRQRTYAERKHPRHRRDHAARSGGPPKERSLGQILWLPSAEVRCA